MIDIEYELRFALSSKTLRIYAIEDVSSPEDVAAFRRSHGTTRTIFQFVDRTDAPTRVPLLRPAVDTGAIDHELVYCEIAVGQAIYASEDYAAGFATPSDYDTFLTAPSAQANGELKLDVNNAYYAVKEQAKILPLYRIKFEYDHSLESSDDKLCESCYAELSVCFCYAERAQLCMKCDSAMHHNELTRRHQRHYFNEENTKFIHCALHSQIVDFWCVSCDSPVCTHCKIKGTHASLVDHALIPYKEAWTINMDALNNDTKVEASIDELEGNIIACENDYEDFVKRILETKALVKEEFDSTINKIDHLQAKNYQIFCRRFLEKRADLERIKRMKSFRPNNFLNFLKSIKEQRMAIHVDLDHLEIEPIKVTGGFRVNTKDVSKREGVRPKRMSSDFYYESVE